MLVAATPRLLFVAPEGNAAHPRLSNLRTFPSQVLWCSGLFQRGAAI